MAYCDLIPVVIVKSDNVIIRATFNIVIGIWISLPHMGFHYAFVLTGVFMEISFFV